VKISDEMLALIRQNPLLHALDETQLSTLLSHARVYHLAEAQSLFHQGQAFNEWFICAQGYIKLLRLTAQGDEKIVEIIAAGHSFAEAVLFMRERHYPVHAVALKASVVVGIPAAPYAALLSNSPDTCFQLLAGLSKRVHGLLNEVERLSLRDATFRLVHWLLATQQQTQCNPIELDIPKHVLASRLSITPETLSRILKRLSEQEIIQVQEHSILLLNLPALRLLSRV
jgi:CRP-like cAMP-binding protein